MRGSLPGISALPEVEAGGPAEEVVVLVVRMAKAFVDRLRAQNPEGASSSMTIVHGLAARYLVGRENVTTVELARYLGITKQSTSEVVALLEQAGIVRRAPHPTDGRARVLLLTDEGVAKLTDARRRWTRLEDEWAELVGRDQLDVVRDALESYLAADLAMRDDGVVSGRSC
ncbi:MAG TPA: MarR family transcriptional regulator [Acidimicrobiales bacterium]